jgi:hypothetical protein
MANNANVRIEESNLHTKNPGFLTISKKRKFIYCFTSQIRVYHFTGK